MGEKNGENIRAFTLLNNKNDKSKDYDTKQKI